MYTDPVVNMIPSSACVQRCTTQAYIPIRTRGQGFPGEHDVGSWPSCVGQSKCAARLVGADMGHRLPGRVRWCGNKRVVYVAACVPGAVRATWQPPHGVAYTPLVSFSLLLLPPPLLRAARTKYRHLNWAGHQLL